MSRIASMMVMTMMVTMLMMYGMMLDPRLDGMAGEEDHLPCEE